MSKNYIKIRVIGSGFGESILININNQKLICIDANADLLCTNENGINLIEDFFNKKIKDLKISSWIITHYHQDHYKSFSRIINNYTIDRLVVPSDILIQDYAWLIYYDTLSKKQKKIDAHDAESEYLDLKTAISKLDNIYSMESGDYETFLSDTINNKPFNLGIYCLSKKEENNIKRKSLNVATTNKYNKSKGRIINKTSYISLIKFGKFNGIFLADAPISRIRRFLNSLGEDLNISFIKAGHHGSKSSIDNSILSKLKSRIKQFVFITPYNKSSLPKEEVVKLYKNNGFNVFVTTNKLKNIENKKEVDLKLNDLVNDFIVIEASNVFQNISDYTCTNI